MSIFSPITFKLEQKKEKLLTVIQRVFSHGRTKVLIFLVAFLLFTTASVYFPSVWLRLVTDPVQAQGSVHHHGSHPEDTTQVIYAPTTGLPQADRAELVLNNNSPDDLVVTPTRYSQEGLPYIGAPITLRPLEVRYIPVSSLAPSQFQGQGGNGGISLSFFGGMLEVGAQITLFGQGTFGSVDIPFSAAGDFKSKTQEAVWWSPNGAEVLLALGNSSDTRIEVKAVFDNGDQQNVQIDPFATATISHQSLHSGADGGAESVRLEQSGAVGSLRVAGCVRSAAKRFTSMIRFYDTQKVRQPNLFATNLRLENATPHLVVKNTSSEAISITPKFLPQDASAWDPLKLPPVSLAPREEREVDLSPLVHLASRGDVNTVSVEVENSGPTGSLIGGLYSLDKARLITYEVPLRDSGPVRTSTGSYPWRVDEDYSTLVSITNISHKQALFTFVLTFSGGQYVLDPQKIEAGATAVFDLNKMRREQIPDREGRTIPLAVKQGQLVWSLFHGRNEVKLIGRAQITSKAKRVSMSYSCELCCLPRYYIGSLSPNAVNVVVGAGKTEKASEIDINCYGNLTPPYFVPADWSVDDPGTATVSPASGLSTTVTGGATGGTTQVKAFWIAEDWFFDNSIDNCVMNEVPVLQAANVQVIDYTITLSSATVRPADTGGSNTTTVTVQTTPPTAGIGVTLILSELTGSGGHVSHSGTRPIGSLSATQGMTAANGAFSATYTAPIFGGDVAIIAQLPNTPISRGETAVVTVGGLGTLGAGVDYNLVGATATHPDNHYGTSTALTNLPLIGLDYRTQFYGVNNTIPDAERLRYNDMSLSSGGKFEIAGNWGNSSHAEHRQGTNCDLGSSNVPANRHQALQAIFQLRGSPNFLNEGDHWHLRF